jgi:hypothetical protein
MNVVRGKESKTQTSSPSGATRQHYKITPVRHRRARRSLIVTIASACTLLDACTGPTCSSAPTPWCQGSLLGDCGTQFQCKIDGKPFSISKDDVEPVATGPTVIDLVLDGALAQLSSDYGPPLSNLYFSYTWSPLHYQPSRPSSADLTDIEIRYDGQPAQKCTYRPGNVHCPSVPSDVHVVSISFSYDGSGGPVVLDVAAGPDVCTVCETN